MTKSRFILGWGILLYFMSYGNASAQTLTLKEYIGYVKKFHPFVKQANIDLNQSEAKLLKARGAFDPKVGVAFKEKAFKENPYYEKLNATFSIPTPYGVEFKAELSEAEGSFLNPENYVSGNQIYAVGADLNLGKGLWANKRTIALKKAKRFVQQAEEENRLEVNKILETATHAFLDWHAAYQQWLIVGQFVENAAFRFEGVKKRIKAGDLAPIDSIEARIAYNNRKLIWEKSRIKLNTTALKASNFLWLEKQPIEIKSDAVPILEDENLLTYTIPEGSAVENHPKIKTIRYKIQQGQLEQQLQRNNLLPEIKLGYRWLSATNPLQTFQAALDPENNITQLKIKMPLFLRKERANLKLSSLKLNDLYLQEEQAKWELNNKIVALDAQQSSLMEQKTYASKISKDYKTLYLGEQKKFDAGESSLFLINSREAKWLEASQKFIALQQAQLKTKMSYFYLLRF